MVLVGVEVSIGAEITLEDIKVESREGVLAPESN